MPLLNVIIVIIVVGVGLWAANTYIPMAASAKKILNIVVVAFICLWLLQVFGILDSVRNVKVR